MIPLESPRVAGCGLAANPATGYASLWGVDLGHDVGGEVEGAEDALVVQNVGGGKGPPPAVLEPFLRGLVAADEEVPRPLRRTAEKLGLVDVDPSVPERAPVAKPMS